MADLSLRRCYITSPPPHSIGKRELDAVTKNKSKFQVLGLEMEVHIHKPPTHQKINDEW